MAYDDGVLGVYTLTNASAPDKRKLKLLSQHYYGEKTIGVTRFYAAMQADTKIDMLVEIWQDRQVMASLYCIPEDGEQYRITDVQHKMSEQGLKVSVLTLERVGKNYELEQLEEGAGSAADGNGSGLSL